jgi:DNA-binding MarR family transcriptional regulator
MNIGGDARAVADRIARLTTWARRYASAEISSTTVTTLDTLQNDGPLPVSELARRERVSQPAMTSLVNRLAAAGRAERLADPSDGRVALVRITDLGRKVLADRQAARVQGLQAVIAELSAEDRAALLASLPAIDRLISSDVRTDSTETTETTETTENTENTENTQEDNRA